MLVLVLLCAAGAICQSSSVSLILLRAAVRMAAARNCRPPNDKYTVDSSDFSLRTTLHAITGLDKRTAASEPDESDRKRDTAGDTAEEAGESEGEGDGGTGEAGDVDNALVAVANSSTSLCCVVASANPVDIVHTREVRWTVFEVRQRVRVSNDRRAESARSDSSWE